MHHCVVAERFSGWATWVPPAAIRSKCRKASETIYTFPPFSTFYFFFAFIFIFALEWEGREGAGWARGKKRKISVERKYTRNWQFCIYVNNTQAYLLLTHFLQGGGCLGEKWGNFLLSPTFFFSSFPACWLIFFFIFFWDPNKKNVFICAKATLPHWVVLVVGGPFFRAFFWGLAFLVWGERRGLSIAEPIWRAIICNGDVNKLKKQSGKRKMARQVGGWVGGWVGWLAGGVLRCLGWLPSTQLVSCYTTRDLLFVLGLPFRHVSHFFGWGGCLSPRGKSEHFRGVFFFILQWGVFPRFYFGENRSVGGWTSRS